MVLVHDTMSECALQMYEILSKYLLWFSSYRVDAILSGENNMSLDPSRGET